MSCELTRRLEFSTRPPCAAFRSPCGDHVEPLETTCRQACSRRAPRRVPFLWRSSRSGRHALSLGWRFFSPHPALHVATSRGDVLRPAACSDDTCGFATHIHEVMRPYCEVDMATSAS